MSFNEVNSLAVNKLVIGLASAVLRLAFTAAYHRTHIIAWICPLLSAWTSISVFVMSETAIMTATVLSNVIGEAVVVFAALAAMAPAMMSGRTSR